MLYYTEKKHPVYDCFIPVTILHLYHINESIIDNEAKVLFDNLLLFLTSY